MPADEEDVVGAVCFFYDEYGKVAGICCLGALVIFCFTIGGDDGGLVSVVGECESGEIGCVAVRLIFSAGRRRTLSLAVRHRTPRLMHSFTTSLAGFTVLMPIMRPRPVTLSIPAAPLRALNT